MATCCFVRMSIDGLLMHVFSAVFTLFSFTSLFLFSLLFFFQLSLFPALIAIPFPFMATITIYIGLSLCDFSILPLLLTNHFCLLWAPFQSCPLATRPPLHLGMPNAFSLFHYLFHNKSLFVWFCHGSISLISTGKALGFSLSIFMACIKWSKPFTTYFGQKCLPSRAPPKRGIG